MKNILAEKHEGAILNVDIRLGSKILRGNAMTYLFGVEGMV
jgi:hypothetical protein